MSFLGLPDDKVDITIENDGFYPDLSVGYIQEYYRIPSEFESGMVMNEMQLAIAWANEQLTDWKAAQIEAGYATLKDVPAEKVGVDTTKELHYRHAVCCRAKANLLPQYDTMLKAKVTRSGSDVEDSETQADTFFRNAAIALAALQGKSTVMVDLL